MIDPNFKEQAGQQSDSSQLPINVLQPQMNVMTPVNTQQPMSIYPYPMGVPTPIMNIQHNPFNIPPPLPMHLHTGVPLVQVAASTNVSQGPPPPPPPPPPSQQINYIGSQPDGKQLQVCFKKKCCVKTWFEKYGLSNIDLFKLLHLELEILFAVPLIV